MDNLHQLLVQRRSIRRYTPDPISPEHVKLMLEAALLAPTSKNSRAWQFILVEDKETLRQLGELKPNYAVSIANAPLAIVVAVDPAQTEAWVEDASIAATYIQLQAADLGLGTCWIEVNGRYRADGQPSVEYVQQLLGIPPSLPVVCVISVGHPDESKRPHDTDRLLWEKVHIGQWKETDLPE